MEFIFDIDVIKALNIYLVAASSLIEKALFHCFKNSTFIKIKFLHVLGVVSGFISYLFICFVLVSSIPEPCCFNYCHSIICFIV